MGFARADRFKELKLMARRRMPCWLPAAGLIAEYGLGAEEVRDVVIKDLLEI